MARLNEVPAPADTIESLKRRFIRQNRDIARDNSNQAVRIRELEHENLHLQTDNILLRQKMIRFGSNGFRACPADFFVRLESIKSQFQEKMRDIGGLIEMLAMLQHQAVSPSEQEELWDLPIKRRSRDASPAALEPRKSFFNFEKGLPYPESRLQPVFEDNASATVSLGSNEVHGVLSDDEDDVLDKADSPDLGPPPVVHLDTDEEAELPNLRNKKKAGPERAEPVGLNWSKVMARIDDRKKRRESANVFDFKTEEDSSDEPATSSSSHDLKSQHTDVNGIDQPSKKAAQHETTVDVFDGSSEGRPVAEGRAAPSQLQDKAKDGARDGVKQSIPRLAVGGMRSARDSVWTQENGVPDQEKGVSSQAVSPERPALAPKNPNSDPASPRKQVRKPVSVIGHRDGVENKSTPAISASALKLPAALEARLAANDRRREQRQAEEEEQLRSVSKTLQGALIAPEPVVAGTSTGGGGGGASSSTTQQRPRSTRSRSHSDPVISPRAMEKNAMSSIRRAHDTLSLPVTPEDALRSRRLILGKFQLASKALNLSLLDLKLRSRLIEGSGPAAGCPPVSVAPPPPPPSIASTEYDSPRAPASSASARVGARNVSVAAPSSIASTERDSLRAPATSATSVSASARAGARDFSAAPLPPPPSIASSTERDSPRAPVTATATATSASGVQTPAPSSSTTESSRPARRPRSSVNYAEPNLRDKMRRPTKDFVDAVAGSRLDSTPMAESLASSSSNTRVNTPMPASGAIGGRRRASSSSSSTTAAATSTSTATAAGSARGRDDRYQHRYSSSRRQTVASNS